MFPNPDRYYFLGRRGTTSDDYDHACMTVEAICASGGNVDLFVRELAGRIKVWAACIPGGIGLATLKSSIKLWCGVNPKESGVFSAGNGPAMRSHIIGTCIDDLPQMVDFVRASTLITHSDAKAFAGALVIALASRHSTRYEKMDATSFHKQVTELIQAYGCDTGLLPSIAEVVQSISCGEATKEFAIRYGQHGVSGYIYHTVPVVIHAWLSHPEDLLSALKTVISCGGDTDTTGSIVGGIIGARVGIGAIPKALLDGLILWPRGIPHSALLASKFEQGKYDSCASAWQYLLHNAWFNPMVLLHGLRRLGPPY